MGSCMALSRCRASISGLVRFFVFMLRIASWNSRNSCPVSDVGSVRSSGAKPKLLRDFLFSIGMSAIVIVPESGFISPVTMCSVVVFPDPFGPSKP